MKNKQIIEAVTERDIDLLVLEELNVNDHFSKWFYKTVTEKRDKPSCIGAWHSITDANLGESDLIAIYDNGIAILIENKVDAIAQPDQGDRYKKRGKRGIENGYWNSFITCLFAPGAYLKNRRMNAKYDKYLSYEEMISYFTSRDVDAERAKYKRFLLEAAIDKNKRCYVKNPNKKATIFWEGYYSVASQQYPELEMKEPGIKGSDSDWIHFNPAVLEKQYSIVHKLSRGDVDLQISGAAGKVNEFIKVLSGYPVEVVQATQSLAIRRKVSPINKFETFESQKKKVIDGLNAASEILKICLELPDLIKGKSFTSIEEQIRLLRKEYNPDDINLHFESLPIADAKLFDELLAIGRNIRDAVQDDQSMNPWDFYKYDIYDYFLLIKGASWRVYIDKSQNHFSEVLIIELSSILIELFNVSAMEYLDITKRNKEALLYLLGTFKNITNLNIFVLAKAMEMDNQYAIDLVKLYLDDTDD